MIQSEQVRTKLEPTESKVDVLSSSARRKRFKNFRTPASAILSKPFSRAPSFSDLPVPSCGLLHRPFRPFEQNLSSPRVKSRQNVPFGLVC